MWTGLSAPAVTALTGHVSVVDIKVEVWTSAGVFLQDITEAVTAGAVTEDETAAIRRTLTLTLNDPTLVPNVDGDLLHPLTGNELKVYRGVLLPGVARSTSATNGTLAPLGVFRISNPATDDTAQALSLTVTGNDRSFAISQRKWTGPYVPTVGSTVGAAIQAIINAVWTGPPLTFNFYPSAVTIAPGTVMGVQFTSTGPQAQSGSQGGNNDRWGDCVALAKSAGCELFFDRLGVCVMRLVPQPGTLPSVVSFAEGPGCKVTGGSRKLDETTFANKVYVIGTGPTVTNSDGSTSPGPPVVGSAASTSLTLGPSGPLGEIPTFIMDETAATVAQANTAAAAQLPLVMSALDGPAFTAADDPRLDAGDPHLLKRSRMKLNGQYIIQSVVHPLDAVTAMQVTDRSFAVGA